jgi:glycosyltransferase involved in cell wall biosynthesis
MAEGVDGRVRIAFLTVSDQLGGSEVALVDMIKGLRRLRPTWAVQLLLPGRGPLLARAEAAGAECVVVPMPRALRRAGEFAGGGSAGARLVFVARLAAAALSAPGYLRRLRRALAAQPPSILHTNGFKAHLAGARVARGSRLLWHVHEYVSDRGLSRRLLARLLPAVSVIVANSASVAADVRAALAPDVPVHVLHNAVDLSVFKPQGEAEDLDRRAGVATAPAGVVRIGLVATFARWKGHDVFLRAIAALPRDLPLRGYIVGEPIYDTAGSQHSIAELKARAAALGVADRVVLTGYLRAGPAMRALDVVVHASTRPEPFGLAIAEAMACGRAVVTSGGGGAAELIEPGVDALTHRPGDSDDLARVLERLVRDAGLRQRLGEAAQRAAAARFDPDRMAAGLIAIYEGLE